MAQFSVNTNNLLNNNNTLYEVVMVGGGISGYVPAGNLNTQADAFGKVRTADPFTLFDSSFRFGDNERKWNTKLKGSSSAQYQTNQGLVDLVVNGTSGDEVIRQTDKIFPYQPGKSLLILNTFTMDLPRENLRQRVGYFTRDNGVYLEVDNLETYIVLRSNVTGNVVNTRIPQTDWSIDKLDGTGPSGVVLDLTKSQIFWSDIEWLGVGSVRCGFVINGQYIVSHIFHHANYITGTYMTTASLSCRYEISNTGTTSVTSTFKQICSTVISEGGYQQTGLTRSVSNPLAGVTLANNVDNPTISIRLRPYRTDAVVIPTEITLYGLQNTAFNYKLIRRATVAGGSWLITDSASSVEYNLTATGITGGVILQQGIFRGQETVPPQILSDLFNGALQLARDIIDSDSSGDTLTLTITPTSNNNQAITSMSWQEKTG